VGEFSLATPREVAKAACAVTCHMSNGLDFFTLSLNLLNPNNVEAIKGAHMAALQPKGDACRGSTAKSPWLDLLRISFALLGGGGGGGGTSQ